MLPKNLSLYCRDDVSKIENYEAAVSDQERTWQVHHRLELTLDGEFAHTYRDLIRMDMYFNRPYFELILLPLSEHARLHGKTYIGERAINYNREFSESHRQKISEYAKKRTGDKNPMFGRKHTEESRKKMSEKLSGKKRAPMSEETKEKIRQKHLGIPAWNKGKKMKRVSC